ncbi:Helix-turn-helix [Noviherbaspirillum humi]|uniref:Helix-turn-helix n=1 Tax=Noviherbaspirillum humi TaxID=1688639 RepID=A0A239JRK8_9BURK|nr:helix-turn-helix transcriptional regulator [Noviherbaspirillum humi]SNT08409.1 Helix-turn-helix [Noviherbaspirillum humi]
MPKKILPHDAVPTLVQERLRQWGGCIRNQRLVQQMRRADLCERMGISDNTLRRLESGDSRPGIGLYFSALYVLGLLDLVVPALPPELWAPTGRSRARRQHAVAEDDDDF